jgi:hypothetical protein
MKLILTEEQYKLLLKENEEPKSLEQFYEENGINKDDLSYLGKGDFGTAYSIGDGRVLKETSSKTEFEIAKQLENDNAPVLNAFAKIYKAEIVDGKMLIILEELDTDSKIEDLYYELQNLLEPQGLQMQYLDYLDIEGFETSDEYDTGDEDEYETEKIETSDEYDTGDEDEYETEKIEISDELKEFISDMEDIIKAYRYLGIEASDIRPENLGYAEDDTLKAFDIDDKRR